MSILAKILLAFVLCFLLMAGIDLSLLYNSVRQSHAAIEQREIAAHMGRLEQSFEASASGLRNITNDWSIWDSMYRYALKPDPRWAKENVNANALEPADISLIMIFARNGRLLLHHSTLDKKEQPEFSSSHSSAYLNIINKPPPRTQCGIMRVTKTPLLACWSGILPGDGKGDPVGTVFMGRQLDAERLQKLREQIRLPFDLLTATELPEEAAAWPQATVQGILGNSQFASTHDDDKYRLYLPVKDILGEKIGTLTLDIERQVHKQGIHLYQQVRQQVLWTLVLLSILLPTAMHFIFVRRLRKLAGQLDTLAGNADWRERIAIRGNDELGLVVRNVNRLLELIQSQMGNLSHLSLTDALTGLANRRAFDDKLAQELARAQRSESSLALLMIDVDHFKRYNDHYGHPAGDKVLKSLGQSLKETLRHPPDVAARIGGEEFAVLLPETDVTGALITAERIRHKLSALAIEHADSPISQIVTVSIGIALAEHDEAENFLRRADQALYIAKRNGRNRVFCDAPAGDMPQGKAPYSGQ